MPFREITGHTRLVALLSRAVARETLPPALLLAGAAGVGKRRTALALATTLNCPQPRSSAALERDACGECPSCRRIARGVHPDVILVEPGEGGAIKIEQVRDVIDRSQYRPFEGRRRVVVIDEADAMVPEAQHAMLKTLEEPPSASVFLLVSSMPDSLLATVRSRCPRLRFGPLSAAEVAAALIRDHGLTERDARAAAADADGSIGQALSARSVDLGDAREAAQRLLEQTARADPARRIEAAKELFPKKEIGPAERDRIAVCFRALGSLLRDLSVISAGASRATLVNADLESRLAPLATAFDAERAARAYAAVDHALGVLEGRRNVNPKVVADWLVLQL